MPAVFSSARICASATVAGPEMSNNRAIASATAGSSFKVAASAARSSARATISARLRPATGASPCLSKSSSIAARVSGSFRCTIAVAQPIKQTFDIACAPEMPLEPQTPLPGQSERVHQRIEQSQITDAKRKILKTHGLKCLDCQR